MLLIRQNIWTFPIGLIYAAITVVVMYHQRLYSNVIENLYYLVMNGYGWYYWLRGAGSGTSMALPVARFPRNWWPTLVLGSAVLSALVGWLFQTYTGAALAYWDSVTTVLSFVAMWLTARKYLENWWLWLVVDVLYVGIYWAKDLGPYALLYGIYIVLAVQGLRSWTHSLESSPSSSV